MPSWHACRKSRNEFFFVVDWSHSDKPQQPLDVLEPPGNTAALRRMLEIT